MKAAEPFRTITPHEREIELHRERLRQVKKRLDTDNSHAITKSQNPRLKKGQQAIKQAIAKENLALAKRIFEIMEKPSPIVEVINDTRSLERHPGTLNFRARLSEAQRIHNQNMILATRLDSMQPHYKKTDLCVVLNTAASPKRKRRPKSKRKKTRFQRELDMVMNSKRDAANTPFTARSSNSPSNYTSRNTTANADTDQSSQRTPQNHNVLLEYTKIQDGRVLEVAVIKEPFRDRFAIFGIDVNDGQRYELRLSSEEVTNVLDGDILVTSVENIEVWMALLSKVELRKVEHFVKALPGSAQRLILEDCSPATVSRGGPAVADDMDRPNSKGMERVPSRPAGSKPSSSGRTSAARLAALRPVLTQSREKEKEVGSEAMKERSQSAEKYKTDRSRRIVESNGESGSGVVYSAGLVGGQNNSVVVKRPGSAPLAKASFDPLAAFADPIDPNGVEDLKKTIEPTPIQKKSPRVANLKAAEETITSTLNIIPSAPSLTANTNAKTSRAEPVEPVQPLTAAVKVQQELTNSIINPPDGHEPKSSIQDSTIDPIKSNAAPKPSAAPSVGLHPDRQKSIINEIVDVVSKTASLAITDTLHSVGKQ